MTAFATASEVETRLGRDLTGEETAQVEAVLDGIGGLIRDEVGKPPDWTPTSVPAAFGELSIQKAILALVNPNNLASTSRTLGAFAESMTFQREQDGGVFLSRDEGRRMRRAYYGTSAASARMRSQLVDDVLDYADNGLLDDSLGS